VQPHQLNVGTLIQGILLQEALAVAGSRTVILLLFQQQHQLMQRFQILLTQLFSQRHDPVVVVTRQ
jgi:hypothetical protein